LKTFEEGETKLLMIISRESPCIVGILNFTAKMLSIGSLLQFGRGWGDGKSVCSLAIGFVAV
jgi:hypothetical protein